jgi:hypothetical protein
MDKRHPTVLKIGRSDNTVMPFYMTYVTQKVAELPFGAAKYS